jgi:hypothetical protein
MIEHKGLDLRHFYNLSDDTGVFSNAIFNLPDKSGGYLTRDNASALSFAIRYYALTQDKEIQPFISLYLSFIYDAFNPKTRRFRTLLLSSGDWVDEGLDLDQGLAIWALGLGSRFAPEPESFLCASLVNQSIGVLSHCADANTIAATLIGLSHYSLYRDVDKELSAMMHLWFKQLTKHDCNSVKVYWALIQSADAMGYVNDFHTAIMRFKVWVQEHTLEGVFHFKDESPEAISLLVGASVIAYKNTKDVFWRDTAKQSSNRGMFFRIRFIWRPH